MRGSRSAHWAPLKNSIEPGEVLITMFSASRERSADGSAISNCVRERPVPVDVTAGVLRS